MVRVASILGDLAAVLPQAQSRLDQRWLADLNRARSVLEQCRLDNVPKLAEAVLPTRFVFTRQTLRVSCHVSVRRESGLSFGASLRFTPLSIGIVRRHQRAFDCACCLELTVEQTAMDLHSRPSQGETS